jgi:sulfatase modifying factor 1
VNISYERVNYFAIVLQKFITKNPKRKFKKVVFRLPTEAEWILAAQAVDSTAIYAWKGIDLKNKRWDLLCNIKRTNVDMKNDVGKNNNYADIIASSLSYWPNAFGIFNMCGNVAEMVAEKGISKGGSWMHEADYFNVHTNIPYDGSAQIFLGFRYFAEVIEK